VTDSSTHLFSYGMLAMGVLVLAVGVFLACLAFTGQMNFS